MRIRAPLVAFLALFAEIVLLVQDRASAYIGLGAFAYGVILWLIARACIRVDAHGEEEALKTVAKGWRLATRCVVVVATCCFVAYYYTTSGFSLIWNSPPLLAIHRLSQLLGIGYGYGDTALPNFVIYAFVPGLALFALGAKPIELGLGGWRKGAVYVLVLALVLPAIFTYIWWLKVHASLTILTRRIVRNFLSNGVSEEFLSRGLALSHLRAFFSTDVALVLQAILFGLLHFSGTLSEEHRNVVLALAYAIGLNAPIGYFLGLIALRARSIVFTGILHTTLHLIS